MKKSLLSLSAILVLGACSTIPPEAYFDRGAPESLLDVSSEVVNLGVGTDSALAELSQWIERDQPTRAELYCADTDPKCTAAQEVLDLYGVPTMYVASADSSVALVYERVLARDCENRYIDNHINPYNLNHPTFGCSIAANMVQQVSDRQQLVSPNLMDLPDGSKAVQAYGSYLEPSKPGGEGVEDSAIENVRFQ